MTLTSKGTALIVTVIGVIVVGGLSYNQLQLQKQIDNVGNKTVPVVTSIVTVVPTASPSATVAPTVPVRKVLYVPAVTSAGGVK